MAHDDFCIGGLYVRVVYLIFHSGLLSTTRPTRFATMPNSVVILLVFSDSNWRPLLTVATVRMFAITTTAMVITRTILIEATNCFVHTAFGATAHLATLIISPFPVVFLCLFDQRRRCGATSATGWVFTCTASISFVQAAMRHGCY